jgi:hypothetical protein
MGKIQHDFQKPNRRSVALSAKIFFSRKIFHRRDEANAVKMKKYKLLGVLGVLAVSEHPSREEMNRQGAKNAKEYKNLCGLRVSVVKNWLRSGRAMC